MLLAAWLLLERIFKLIGILLLVLWYFNFKKEWLEHLGWHRYAVFTAHDVARKSEGEPSVEWREGYYLTLKDYFSWNSNPNFYTTNE